MGNMDIKVKESIYIQCDGNEYMVRPNTTGTERKRIVYFPDNTRTASVGFSRDFCLENPQMFSISRNITDREVSLKDAIKVLEQTPMDKETRELLTFKMSEL